MKNRPLVLLLCGPTGSGKTELSLLLAERLNAEIISADSMQIYRELDIGTAKASAEEQARVPHHLLDVRDPGERYSVADFMEDARKAIYEILGRGRLPLICGGTGQYLTALLDGLSFPPQTPSLEGREKLRASLLQEGLEAAHARLSELDPESGARIHPHDEKRILRFFELLNDSGLTQSEARLFSRSKAPEFCFASYCLMPGRELLYERINARVRHMMGAGLAEELRGVLKRHPDFPESQAFQAIGYKEIFRCLNGDISEKEAQEILAQASRRYAKRQISLFRSRAEDLCFITECDIEERFHRILDSFLNIRQELE